MNCRVILLPPEDKFLVFLDQNLIAFDTNYYTTFIKPKIKTRLI